MAAWNNGVVDFKRSASNRENPKIDFKIWNIFMPAILLFDAAECSFYGR